MKHAKLILGLLAAIVIIAVGAGYTVGFFVYRKYTETTAQLEERVQDRFKDMDAGLKELYVTLENATDKDAIERKKLLELIKAIKEDMRDWQVGYSLSIAELRKKIEDLKVERLARMVGNLRDDISGFKIKMQDLDLKMDEVRKDTSGSEIDPDSIDLGRISVRK